jgi:YHS domain-containing protein
MRRTLTAAALALTFVAACRAPSHKSAAATAAKHSDMKTIDSSDVRPAVMDPPPVLTEEALPPKSVDNLAQADAPPPPTPQDEAVRAALPFAPAIAMDPVDGSKISIRATTPMTEYKNKIFYFSSEENKRTFGANPDQYAKGPFSHL